VQVASEVAPDFPQGTYFVALDAVSDPSLVASEIATTLGLVGGAEAPIDRLVTFLADKVVLLVLDNMEQVIDAAPDIARLVRDCPDLRVLVTSRIPLQIYGEHEFPVPALGVPPADQDVGAAMLEGYEAARLFVARAVAARPGFAVDDAGASIIADIVRRLDGLPLAIELAAARLRVLPLDALRQRLDDSLAVLTGGGRDRPGRQQTLRGAIEWSHDLLDQPDRRLFARLGVIAGASALPQVEGTCGPAAELGREVFEGLESLSRQSLVRAGDDGGSEPRFSMLATIREYARERLAQSGEEEALRRRHALVYLELAESAAPHLTGVDGLAWNERLEADHDDLRAALDWIVAADDAELGLRMIAALWRFWQVRGHLMEAEDRVAAVLALPSVAAQPPALIARGEGAAGSIAYWRLDRQVTHDRYASALGHARAAGDEALLAESLYNMGFAAGFELVGLNRYTEGKPYFDEALEAYRSLGDRAGEASVLWALHQAAEAIGDVEASQRLARQTLEIARELNDPFRTGWAAFTLALSELRSQGRLEAAAALYLESLEVFIRTQDAAGILFNIAALAEVALQRGDTDGGWRLIGATERLKEESGARLLDEDFGFGEGQFRREPETAEEARLVKVGRAMSRDEAIELARQIGAALSTAD
jgi:predicted ATPase